MDANGTSGEERNKTTVYVTPRAMTALDEYVARRSVLKKTVLSKLIEWFAAQSDSVRSTVMGWVDDDALIAQADVLKKLAAGLEEQARNPLKITTGNDPNVGRQAASMSPAAQRKSDEKDKRKGK